MPTYPVLNDQPIDQWKVTDLKDELCRRNLSINGLKEDLVKRLFEDLQGVEGTISESPPDDVLKEDVTTGSVDASVCQAAVEPSVDEDPSLVSMQNRDLVVSVEDTSKESAVATTDVSHEFGVVTEEVGQITLASAEVSDAPLVDVVTSDKISLSRSVPTKEDDLESAPFDGMVRELHAQAGVHSEFIAEKALEEDAGKKTIVDYLPSNVASIGMKLDVSPAKGKLDDDILEHEVVSPLDAIVPHVDHWDGDAVATALGHNVDALIPKIRSGDNDLMNCKDREDSGRTNSACKPTLSGAIAQTSGILPAIVSTYPVLNNRPIDQWKVTELRDELCRRNLPIKGLKDDLVKMLSQDLEGDILGGSSPRDDLKEDGVSRSADASVCQDVMEQNVDESPSQVATQEGDPAVSVTEASKKSAHATTDICQDAVVTTEEVSQTTLVAATDSDGPLVDCATADTISLSDAVATKGDHLESAPSQSAIVKGASPQADQHSEITAEKAPADGTIQKVIVDYLPYDVASSNLKLDATSAQGKLDADIVEQEAVLSTPDGIVPHTDHLDVHAIATAPGQNAETLIPKIDLGANAFMNGKDREDSGGMNDACKPSLSGKKSQVSEAKPNIGSEIKCVLISHDDISTSVEGDANAENSDLELEAKRDMVKSPCSIPSIGYDVQALDDDKELLKNGTSLQEVEYTTNMSLDKKEDCPEGASPEKLNLDRSSGNEPIEGDVMESKHVIPNITSDDLGRETEVTSDYEVKEVMLFDTVDSSVQTKDIVAEEKPVTPSEKRKPEDQGGVAVEPIKRQRCMHNVKLPKEQTSKSSSDSPKDVVQPALKRSFGRSTAGGYSHREQIVPLSQKPATTSLRIDRFVRPFTLKAVQELLGRTGSICSFWMDHFKTHCYVTYSSVDEAVATRNAVYNLQWPLNNGNYLVAEFVDPHEVKLKLERPPPPPVIVSLSTDTAPKAVAFQQSKANQTMLPHGAGTSRGLLPDPHRLTKLFPSSNPVPEREMLPPPPKEHKTPAMSLNDLFKRTQASPMIYYLPFSEEEVAAKLAARSRRKRG